MKIEQTDRGFRWLVHKGYTSDRSYEQLVGESSAIGDYTDSADHPGSSFLWVGSEHHLNREEVQQLVDVLRCWLAEGRLPAPEEPL